MNEEAMRGMRDEQIERVFSALSRIEANGINTANWMAEHSKSDKELFAKIDEKITDLRLTHSRQKGFLTAVASVGSIVAGVIGYVIEFFVSGRGHH
jgi:hypothetical protein